MRNFFTLFLTGLILCAPAAFGQLTSTNLPIVIITANPPIGNNQIDANLKIIDNVSGINTPTDAPAFNGLIGVKLRGSSSNPKKSYNVETWVTSGVSTNVSLMGMPQENDWVLLACYTDRSLLRDLTGFHIYNQMGYYAPRMRLCEVLVNENGSGNVYMGVYLFGEKIKRDSARLDLATLQLGDNSGDELTGGYILTIDETNDLGWNSPYPPPYASGSQVIRFHYQEPKDDEITGIQKAYIQGYMADFENALNASNFQDTNVGWRGYGAHRWFEDFLIFNEVTKSNDAYRKSTYIYKDKLKKLRVGPPWDLEMALYNTADCNASSDTGWAYLYGQTCGSSTYLPAFWWQRLMEDTAYVTDVKCRYSYLRGNLLDTLNLFHYIDSVAGFLNVTEGGGTAQGRNFTKWPIFGVNLVNEPGGASANYTEEVTRIKTFIKNRLAWLDSKWFVPGCVVGVKEILAETDNVYLTPNPATDRFTTHIALDKTTRVNITVRNLHGAVVYNNAYTLGKGEHVMNHNISELAPALYLVTIQQGDNSRVFKLVKQ